MDTRYSHPEVTVLWSLESIYAQWLHIESTVLFHQLDQGIVPEGSPRALSNDLHGHGALIIGEATVARIAEIEQRTQHDVAAFMEWLRDGVKPSGRWLHYGLTSSDIVDTAQGMRFRDMRGIALDAMQGLMSELARWCEDDTPLLGYTHGQVAEVMTMRARAWQWMTTLATPAADLSRHTNRVAVCKLSGPVGTYQHNPPEIEQAVAKDLDLRPHGPGASQIASRAPLAAWANSAALLVGACGKIAMDVRLMHLNREAIVQQAEGQVGSSAMAHKRNPIGAEQLGGMARLARGYAEMLQPLDVWLERDISHSSVERVAVPDLWHVVMHSIELTTTLLRELTLDKWNINTGIPQAGVDPLVSMLTLQAISDGMGWEEARRWALGRELVAQPKQGHIAMRHYPGGRK
jgi:adenylosuccinate lyase